MSRYQLRHRVALPAALLLIPLAAGSATASSPSPAEPKPSSAVLPGDVRAWEMAHAGPDTPAVLPGDLRLRELELGAVTAWAKS
jgi:hypothetical protein